MTVPSTARRRPPGRYDAPSLLGQRVIAVLLTATLLAVVVAGGMLLFDRFGGDQVRGQVVAFDIRSDRAVSMQIEVSKSLGVKAYCVIRARGASGLEVGRDIAVLDARGSDERFARGTYELATRERAVTAELAGCTPEVISTDDPAP